MCPSSHTTPRITPCSAKRSPLPNIHALNFVMYAALGGGVTRSLSVDMHGKGLSSYLLDMDI